MSGWRVGDRVVIPDTRHLSTDHEKGIEDWLNSDFQTEVLNVESISGTNLTLASSLQFDHKGPRDPDGTPTQGFDGQKLLPHVGNLTRNVMVYSQDPFGTRGHVMFAAVARVSVHHTGWYDLGRTTTENLDSTDLDGDGNVTHMGTNQIARYSLHMHHNRSLARPSMPTGLSPDGIRHATTVAFKTSSQDYSRCMDLDRDHLRSMFSLLIVFHLSSVACFSWKMRLSMSN